MWFDRYTFVMQGLQVVPQQIHAGTGGQAAAMSAFVSTKGIIGDLMSKLKGADFGMWGAAAGLLSPALGWIKNKVAGSTAGKMMREGWSKLRGHGDDLVKASGNSADDVAKAAGQSADDLARGAATGLDDVAKAGSLASRAAGLKMLAGGVARIAVPVAIAADVGMRGYDSYNIESRHDELEKAHVGGALSKEDMQKVTEERNAGHARNAAGFAGGTAGGLIGLKAGASLGAAAGVFTGPAAPVCVPLFTVIGGIAGGVGGYFGGSKIGEVASDTITGHDGSYSHTQRAIENLESNKLAVRDNRETGEAWAKARDKAVQSGQMAIPGQLQGADARQQFAQNMGTGGISGGAVGQVGVEQTSAAIAPLPRAKVAAQPRAGLRRGNEVAQ